MSEFTTQNAHETILSMDDFGEASNGAKCAFLHYMVYSYVNPTPPDYINSETDLKTLENFFWTKAHALAKRYVHRLSGKLSNRVYKMSEAGSQSSDIAIQFYFSLLQASLLERCGCIAEIFFDYKAEQERLKDQDKDQ
jgi:hypothetical protein